jgi:xylulokinase
VKALVASPDGGVLGQGVAGYPVVVPGEGKAESDPQDWWRGTRLAVRQALAEADGVTVTGLAVAGQMHGVVLADDRGAALRPAVLWLDRRATRESASYTELHGDDTAILGNRPAPGMAGPILCWLAAHEPGTLHAAWWALQPKDWLRLRLTGQAATDPTDASGTLLFDLTANAWADDLIKRLGLPGELLPPVRESTEIAGGLLPGPAAELGLRPGIPVTVGASDTAAALYAVSRDVAAGPPHAPEWAMLTLGSGGQWVVPISSLAHECAIDVPPATPMAHSLTTNLYRAVGGGYYRQAPVRNVGVTLDWVRNLLGATWEELYATASRPRRPDAPRFDPHLTPEHLTPEHWNSEHRNPEHRNPEHRNPAATGAWTGLTVSHEREDLMRSALDGVADLLRQRLADLRAAGHAPRHVILGGSGTANPAWRTLLAETLALPLTPAPTTWLTPAGAARLAAETATSHQF